MKPSTTWNRHEEDVLPTSMDPSGPARQDGGDKEERDDSDKRRNTSDTEAKATVSSLIRVRNRLAHQIPLEDLDRLQQVMTGLIPRLLRRLDDNALTLSSSSYLEPQESMYREIQVHLTGILSHCLERIRLAIARYQNESTTKDTVPTHMSVAPHSWIQSVAGVLPDLKTSLAQTMTLTLLQAGFHLRHLWNRTHPPQTSKSYP